MESRVTDRTRQPCFTEVPKPVTWSEAGEGKAIREIERAADQDKRQGTNEEISGYDLPTTTACFLLYNPKRRLLGIQHSMRDAYQTERNYFQCLPQRVRQVHQVMCVEAFGSQGLSSSIVIGRLTDLYFRISYEMGFTECVASVFV